MQEYLRTDIRKEDIIPLAERMRKDGRFLVMIHAFFNKDGEPDVSYDFEGPGVIDTYHVVGERVLPSIGGIYDVAAEWPERELNELMGLEFEGLDTSKRLFLPEDLLEEQGRGQILVTPMSELIEKNSRKESVE